MPMWDHETVPKSKYYLLPLRQEHQNSMYHKLSASVFQQEHPHRRKHRPRDKQFPETTDSQSDHKTLAAMA